MFWQPAKAFIKENLGVVYLLVELYFTVSDTFNHAAYTPSYIVKIANILLFPVS
jgi:hypothetical protein